jgi:UDP-MurNAc hydroxylase
MLMEWVNHASFVVESGSVHLICDPWLDGTAFNHGWRLISPTVFRYEECARLTHIWFSHEHPDHFSPSNLQRIPDDLRRRITVLFHYTKDKRVLKVCKAYGFKVQELPEFEDVELAAGFRLICGRQGLIDSWMAVLAEDKTLLNMNDCIFRRREDLAAIKRKLGKVDVLLSQFSYANWVGNPEDSASHARCAQRKRTEMRRYIQIFEPAIFIPFASFIYFSHAENSFMNTAMNRIGDVYEFTTRRLGILTVVLYPGDKWEPGEPRDSSDSIRRYESDIECALSLPPDTSPSIQMTKLQEASNGLIRKCSHKNNRVLLNALQPAVIHLNDLGIDVEVSYRGGLREVVKGKRPDIAMSSDSLHYCLQYDWGGDTLAVNGRYQIPPDGNARRFFRIFRVPAHNSAGNSFDLKFVGYQVVKKAMDALKPGRDVTESPVQMPNYSNEPS